ncbi:MAG: c(7)-type cytochrome triheme domain-containing protein [Burkholderiales bacterium]
MNANRDSFLRSRALALGAAAGLAVALAAPPASAQGKAVYDQACGVCHNAGIVGAPKLGDAKAWEPRLKQGVPALYAVALTGKGGMPARGGNLTLSDAQVKSAVDYIVGQAKARPATAVASAPPAAAPAPAPRTAAQVASTQAAQSPPASALPAPAPSASPSPPAPVPAADPPASSAAKFAPGPTTIAAAAPVRVPTSGAQANAFNRLLRPPSQRNLPPAEDGIHDPGNDGTHLLQPPLEAFGALPRSNAGNRVDWVKSLTESRIQPRVDRVDPKAEAVVMDLNIVREVKGSMPDVVYPHKQHTEWLDCSNCHPAIFIPQKGANQISMAGILLGEKCGVCHGKVAFPVSECRLCHSKPKPTATAAAPAPAR